MAETSPRMTWPYPSENEDPWYSVFADLVRAMDASAFAAREDRNLVVMGGGTVSFDASTGVLSWSSQIELLSSTGLLNLVPAGSLALADGQVLRADITRAPGGNTSVLDLAAAGFAKNTDASLVLAVRRGDKVYWRTGAVLRSGIPMIGLSPAVGYWRSQAVGAMRQSTDLIDTEEVVGGFIFDPSQYGAPSVRYALQFYGVLSVAASGQGAMRLYDMGAPGAPTVEVLRAAVPIANANAGAHYRGETVLTPSAAPAGAGEIHAGERMYELRLHISSDASPGASLLCLWGGIVVDSSF